MGLLRTIFALSVVLDASPFNDGNVLVGGRLAVQLFYVISGFLISYILTANDTYRSTFKFYQNRFLRLFPTYIVVALAVLAVNMAANHAFFDLYNKLPESAVLFLILANIFIVGQDWVMFAGIKNAALVFTGSFLDSDVPLYQGLLVPQAWTLGVELSFYLLAPFFLRSLKWVLVLFLASLCLRGVLLYLGVAQTDPWSYRFFPMELALFLAGSLSHRLLLPAWRKLCKRAHYLPEIATGLFVLYTVFHFSVTFNHNLRDALALVVFVAIMPLTFIFQGRYRLDRRIGSLSYPIYISHSLAILAVERLAAAIRLDNALAISAMNVVFTLALAWALYRAVDSRVEALRQRIKEEQPASGAPVSAFRA